jgi:biotin---protein ligase
MNVLVYSDQEVKQSTLSSTIACLRDLLAPNYTVQSLSQHAFISQPWFPNCALLILLACQPASSTAILRSYVENGGCVLAFSVGARSWSGNVVASLENLAISNEQSLRLHGKTGTESITLEFKYRRDDNPIYVDLECGGECIRGVVCHSPRPSLLDLDTMKGITVLGRFTDDSIAGLKYSVGSGSIVIWAPHLEIALSGDAEKQRLNVLRHSLRECGLRIPTDHVRRTPLPQFLVGQPSTVAHILKELSTGSSTQQLFTIKDANDTFHFHPSTHYSSLLEECRDADPSARQAKHILVHLDGSFPSKQQTPLFDVDLYFKEISKANENQSSTDVWGIGDALLYGEAVTSTQTMLEKCVSSHLPNTSDRLLV